MNRFLLRALRAPFVALMALAGASSSALAIELADYVVDVIDANPIVRQQLHVYRQAVQEEDIAKRGWRPSVDLEGDFTHVQRDTLTNNSQQGDYNSNQIALSVTQNLFSGFDTVHAVRQAEARVKSALYDLYDTIDNVALEAVQAYLNVITQHELLKLARENVESHEETLRQIRVRNESGAARRSELEQTDGRVAQAKAGMIAQHNNLEDAITDLHELLGRYLGLDEFVDPGVPQNIDMTLSQSIDYALANHPALRVAQYNIEAAQHDHKRAKSAYFPSLDLRVAQEINDNLDDSGDNDDELSVSLNLSYNLYNGGSDRAERRRRVSVISEQQEFANQVRRQVINTLRLAWKADELLQKQLEYLNQHVVKSQETVISYQEEFYVGERDLIDLLDAKSEVNSAQNAYAQAYYDSVGARFRSYEGIGDLFDALNIETEVSGKNLVISRIATAGLDTIEAGTDRDFDADKELDLTDHCDNSNAGLAVDNYGCSEVKFPKAYTKNIPPQAVNDAIEVNKNGSIVLTRAQLLANDIDEDGKVLELVNFSQPLAGKLATNIDGELVYRAADGFAGTDSFSYTITDERGANSTAQVTVQVPTDLSLTEPYFVNFEYATAALTPESRKVIDQMIRLLNTSEKFDISILTHTDSDGSEDYNLSLSEERASALVTLLIAEGVDEGRLSATAMGETSPIADNETAEGRAINRRGEFIFSMRN